MWWSFVSLKVQCSSSVLLSCTVIINLFFPYFSFHYFFLLFFFHFIRNQITMAKRLIEDGVNTWNLISQKNDRVRWENIVFDIKDQFMKISCCSSRSLMEQVSSVTFSLMHKWREKNWCFCIFMFYLKNIS